MTDDRKLLQQVADAYYWHVKKAGGAPRNLCDDGFPNMVFVPVPLLKEIVLHLENDRTEGLAEPKFTCETVWGTMLFDSKAFPTFKTNVEYSLDLMSHHKL